MIETHEALARLREGNRRFISHPRNPDTFRIQDQVPFAIILGCSDARVPAEIVFDQGLGDLFVIRVAGNIVAPSQVGSVEFAAARFGTRLVVVLGHSQCGAIVATLEELRRPPSGNRPICMRSWTGSVPRSKASSRRTAVSIPRGCCGMRSAPTSAPRSITCGMAPRCSSS